MATPNLLLPDWGNAGDKLGSAFIQRTQQNRLAAALPGAMSGDQNALAALIKANPSLGIQVQQGNIERQRYDALTKQKEQEARRLQMREGLVDFGATLANAEETQHPTIYGARRTALVQQYPELADRLPEQWSPELLPYAKALAGVKPANAPGPTSDIQNYEFARSQGYPGTLQEWIVDQKKAGAAKTEVSVNSGQKGFDNELKIRSDFRQEPVYKAFQETQAAYNQIGTALDQKSPAGDLAAATKIMKLLDPGSVVRESELGMAIAASGALDRMTNYANRVITGEKLSESQRADFRKLADGLYDQAVDQYSGKRDEYHQIATDYDMDAERVTGPAPKGRAKPPGPTQPKEPPAVGTMKGGYRFKGGNPADPASWEKTQ